MWVQDQADLLGRNMNDWQDAKLGLEEHIPELTWYPEDTTWRSKWVEAIVDACHIPARIMGDCLGHGWQDEQGNWIHPKRISRWRYYDETV